MAVRVAGNWELSWNTPLKEADLWAFVLRDFDIKDWFMWPVTGIKHCEHRSVGLHEYPSIEGIFEANQDFHHVYVEPANSKFAHSGVSLKDFQHPSDALYIFGSAHFNPMVCYAKEEDQSIFIPTVHNAGVLWPHQCLAVIMYDRLLKDGAFGN